MSSLVQSLSVSGKPVLSPKISGTIFYRNAKDSRVHYLYLYEPSFSNDSWETELSNIFSDLPKTENEII